LKINPQLTPYRPAPQQYLPPAAENTFTLDAATTAKPASLSEDRVNAEEKLRQAIEAKQVLLRDAGLDGIAHAPELGKLLDLRA
jgi:hypothetical protein